MADRFPLAYRSRDVAWADEPDPQDPPESPVPCPLCGHKTDPGWVRLMTMCPSCNSKRHCRRKEESCSTPSES